MSETQEFETGEEAINATVEKSKGSPDSFQRTLRENAEGLDAQEKAKVDQYRNGIRGSLQGVMIDKLPDNVGGLYDGSVKIAQSTLEVRGSIEETLAMANETWKHEQFHLKNKHLEPVNTGASAQGENVVTIGGRSFTNRGIHEAITVANTGERFVSGEYRQFAQDLRSGLSSAGLTMAQAHEAINVKKDLSLIDDVSRTNSK